MKLFLKLFIIVYLCLFEVPNDQKKIIYDKEFEYQFYVNDTKNSIDKNLSDKKEYFWFKDGLIHKSIGASGGWLLNSTFLKYKRDGTIVEKGTFNNGLKIGVWYLYNPEGKFEKVLHYRSGLLHGNFESYSQETGDLEISGSYKNGEKSGKWINHLKLDTIIYKNGMVKIKDTTLKKGFIYRLFHKREKDTLHVDTTTKKDGFFKRLFHKSRKDSVSTK